MHGELSLDLIRTFLAVCRAGSLSQAGRELGLSQPTVTAQIAALERDLGYALFARTTSGVTPNARADSLRASVAPHLDGLERALWAAQPGLLEQQRAIQIAGPAEYLSVRVLRDLTAWQPDNVAIRMTFGLAEHLLADLRAGVHDILVSSVPVRGSGYAVAPLFDEEFALVGAPAWVEPWRASEAGDRGKGDGIPVIAYSEDLPIIRRWWLTVWGERPSGLNIVATVPDLRTITDMVANGVGVSVLPTYLVDEHLAHGSLVRLSTPEVPPLNTLYLVTRAGALSRDAVLAQVHDALVAHERPRGSAPSQQRG